MVLAKSDAIWTSQHEMSATQMYTYAKIQNNHKQNQTYIAQGGLGFLQLPL